MLLSTDIVRRIRGQTEGYQQVVMSGRWVSATFAAISVILLTLIAWKAFGLLGAWCMGLSVAVCPIIGMTAHFLKEDATLLLGFSIFLLTVILWLEKPTARRLIYLGLGCGIAASAKYLGALFLLPAITLIIMHPNRAADLSLPRCFTLFLLPAVAIFSIINFPIFDDFGSFIDGITKGGNSIVQGLDPSKLPNTMVIKRIGQRLSVSILLLAAAGAFILIAAYRRSLAIGWALLITSVFFTSIQMMTPLPVPSRYILLPAVGLHGLAGLSIVMVVNLISRNQTTQFLRRAQCAGAIAAVALVLSATPAYRSFAINAFHQADARAEMIDWINTNLGSDTKLAAFHWIRVPGVNQREVADPTIQLKHDIITLRKTRKRLDTEDFIKMRADGITHLIVRNKRWKQYLAREFDVRFKDTPSLELRADFPKVVWVTPNSYDDKNRWLREATTVLQL